MGRRDTLQKNHARYHNKMDSNQHTTGRKSATLRNVFEGVARVYVTDGEYYGLDEGERKAVEETAGCIKSERGWKRAWKAKG